MPDRRDVGARKEQCWPRVELTNRQRHPLRQVVQSAVEQRSHDVVIIGMSDAVTVEGSDCPSLPDWWQERHTLTILSSE
jgi:hypothetical protein